MFVVYKDPKAPRDGEYQMFAGNKYNVNKKLPLRELSGIGGGKVLEFATDLEIVNLLKGKEAVKEAFNLLREKGTQEELTKFKRVLLRELLLLHSCVPDNFQVCRECGQMMDTQADETIGTISLKSTEIQKLLNIEQNWACSRCRIELALITWLKHDGKTYDSEIIYGKTQEVKDKTNELLRENFTHVRTVVKISPCVDDYNVVTQIRKKLGTIKNLKENETKYKHLIIKSFILYHIETETLNAIRICERCGHFWKKHKDLGYSSMDTYEICKILENRNWVCTKCVCSPLLELHTYKGRDNSVSYSIAITGQTPKKALESQSGEYVRKYVCLELYAKLDSNRILRDIYNSGIVRNIGEKHTSSLSEFDLMRTILKTFIFSLNLKEVNICKYCNHIFDARGNEHGYYWAYRDLPLPFPYVCSFHAVRNILFWNMTGWKTIEKVKSAHKKILEDADIIFLIETHLVDRMNAETQDYFSERIIVNVAAEKRSLQGRGSGGLMCLIKSEIMCNQTKMDYSNKGVFQKIQFPNEVLIVGGVYWRPEPGNTEYLEDWIKELDNFLLVNKNNDIKLIIGGDFNGRVKDDDSYKDSLLFKESAMTNTRKSVDSVWNKRGRQLMALMRKHRMVLCNGRTKSDKKGGFTSRTVNGESVVDYVWVSSNLVPQIQDMAVQDIYSTSSDFHRGLQLKLT